MLKEAMLFNWYIPIGDKIMLSSEKKAYEDQIKKLKAQSDCRVAYVLRSVMGVVNRDKYLGDDDKKRLSSELWKLYGESLGEIVE